jgi:hypothetical protein
MAAAAVALIAAAAAQGPPAGNLVFVNGKVFDGTRFVARPLYVTADGLFSRSRPAGAEIDLAGGYVIPPFGEGHNHNIDSDGPSIDISRPESSTSATRTRFPARTRGCLRASTPRRASTCSWQAAA